MSKNKSGAVSIFIGLLLIAVFIVGLVAMNNPAAFTRKNYYDHTLDFVVNLCRSIWLPAGIIGIPLLLISLLISLRRERRNR